MKASGYSSLVLSLIVSTGLLALLFSPFSVYSVCIAATTAATYQSPEIHPDVNRRWLAVAAAGVFYIPVEIFGNLVTGLMVALPVSRIQMLAGLTSFGMISSSLYQALRNEAECNAAIMTLLITAGDLMVFGIGSVSWELIAGGIYYLVLTLFRRA